MRRRPLPYYALLAPSGNLLLAFVFKSSEVAHGQYPLLKQYCTENMSTLFLAILWVLQPTWLMRYEHSVFVSANSWTCFLGWTAMRYFYAVYASILFNPDLSLASPNSQSIHVEDWKHMRFYACLSRLCIRNEQLTIAWSIQTRHFFQCFLGHCQQIRNSPNVPGKTLAPRNRPWKAHGMGGTQCRGSQLFRCLSKSPTSSGVGPQRTWQWPQA